MSRRTLNRARRVVLAAALGMSMFARTPVSAQDGSWFAGLYAGAGSTRSADVIGNHTLSAVRFDGGSLDIGARAGVWVPGANRLGVAVDIVRFSTDIPRQEVDVCSAACSRWNIDTPAEQTHLAVAVTPMLRVPLMRDAAFPDGRVQPYVAAGGMFVVSTWREDGAGQGSTSSFAATAGAGVTLSVTRYAGVFVDYRMSRFTPEYAVSIGDEPATVSNELIRSRLVGGISITPQRRW